MSSADFCATAAPDDRNLISFSFDAGLTYQGLVPSRPDDTVGLGIAYGRISPQAAAYDRDLVAATGTAMPIRDYETAIELTYRMQVVPNWTIQPDLQYVWNPGGGIPNPLVPGAQIKNEFVLGLRTVITF